LDVAAIKGHIDALIAIVDGDKPGILTEIRAAVCCGRSALMHAIDEVSVVTGTHN
jgi:hypothetical protein